jgi:hypothetical protein
MHMSFPNEMSAFPPPENTFRPNSTHLTLTRAQIVPALVHMGVQTTGLSQRERGEPSATFSSKELVLWRVSPWTGCGPLGALARALATWPHRSTRPSGRGSLATCLSSLYRPSESELFLGGNDPSLPSKH